MDKLKYILLLHTIFLVNLCYSSQCYTEITTSPSGWIAADGTPYYLAYACGLRSDHAAITSSMITLTVDNNAGTCPGDCSNLPYACAEIASSIITSCMVASATKEPYEEIHMKFIGNDTTEVSLGFYTNGQAYQAGPVALPFSADEDFHLYAFDWTSNSIIWYVDGKEISSEMGSRPIPTTPNRFIVNLLIEMDGVVTDDSSINTALNIDRNFVIPTSPVQSSFSNLTFIPVMYESCDGAGILPPPANWTPADPNVCTDAPTPSIYSDSLASGWSDAGSTSHSLTSTTYFHSGAFAISWDVIPKAILNLAYSKMIDTSSYFGFEFWVYGGGTSGQQITIQLLLPGGTSSSINMDQVLVSGIQAWTWSRVVLPFSIFGIAPGAPATGLVLTSVSTGFEGTIYIDDLKYTQEFPLCANRTLTIYDDKLENHFLDFSWGTYDLKSTDVVYSGAYSIAWTLYNNDGIQFHTNSPVDTNIYQAVSIWVNYQQLQGWLINIAVTVNSQPVGTMGLLDYYSGTFPSGTWVEIIIPFSEFGVLAGTPVDGIELMCNTNNYQGVLYIDNIAFTSPIPTNISARLYASFAAILLQILAVYFLA